jgi:hypothetical protein
MWRRGVLTVVLLAAACGGNGAGNQDQAACEALRDAQGENEAIYDDLRGMRLSAELRGALDDLEAASTGDEIDPAVFEAATRVDTLCEGRGVTLAG